MKFKGFNLRAYRHNSLVTLSFDKKDFELRCITSKIKYIDTGHHLKIKIPHGLAENYKAIREIKEEIKQVQFDPITHTRTVWTRRGLERTFRSVTSYARFMTKG